MIDVVLPVLDEAGALPWVLGRVPPGYRAIVVDNGSVDGSATVAAQLGAVVVSEPRRGFGAACWAGLTTATSDIVCFLDADASLDPAELPALVNLVVSGRADLAIGARRPTRGSWPIHGRAANRYLARVVRRRSGLAVSDIGPMRAAPRRKVLALGMVDRGFGWPLEMLLRAGAAGWRVVEIPVAYGPRVGRSKVTGTIRGTARAVRDMRRVLATS